MSCAPGSATFRLLDARVGWDPRPGDGAVGLVGLDDPAGLRLAVAGTGDGPTRHDLLPWFPDPRLAPGCGPCAWYLSSPGRGLRRRRDCAVPECAVPESDREWAPVRPAGPHRHHAPTVVAARGHLLAVADHDHIRVWRREGGQLVAIIPGPAGALAFTAWNELLVVRPGGTDIERYDLTGDRCGRLATCVSGTVEGLTTGAACSLWVLTRDRDRLLIWRGTRDGGPFAPATLAELAAAVPRTALSATSDLGFCLTEPGTDGVSADNCYTWDGVRLHGGEVGAPVPPGRRTSGELLTTALDSGLPRCRWHRVRVDADTPPGTEVEVTVATAEVPTDLPEPQDWQVLPSGARDGLVDQPAGRYLFVRLRLHGDGVGSPTVRQVRLDFPRVTSAELLPPVYRQDPAADDFTERFLSLFDASLAPLDRVVERYPALLDAQGVPDELLPWLGGFLGLVFDPAWDARTRRELLLASPGLYRRRGTARALAQTLRIVFQAEPVIDELARDRNWATLGGGTPLGGTRLFGRSVSRFRLDTSALGGAPLRSYGNPDDDPVTAQAYRIRVFLPPRPGPPPDTAAVARLVADTAPAHLVADIRSGGTGFVVGSARTGVDTVFGPLPAPVLGGAPAGHGQPVRLSRASVLWPGRRGSGCGIQVGLRSVVAVSTVAQ
jgi:phage tail-like protein